MFQYRIFPTKKQLHKLNETLEECRWLYNHLLEQRKTSYDERGESFSLYQQQETFGTLKQERPTLKQVHSQVLQNVAVRVDLAFKAFFRRVRKHAKDPAIRASRVVIAMTASPSRNRAFPSPMISEWWSPRWERSRWCTTARSVATSKP